MTPGRFGRSVQTVAQDKDFHLTLAKFKLVE